MKKISKTIKALAKDLKKMETQGGKTGEAWRRGYMRGIDEGRKQVIDSLAPISKRKIHKAVVLFKKYA